MRNSGGELLVATQQGGRHEALPLFRYAIQSLVFDLGDQAMASEFSQQSRTPGAALPPFGEGAREGGIQMRHEIFVAKPVQGRVVPVRFI